MKVYLVGGAVRDQLLGLPVLERDWVVVGSTPANLCQQGYQPVGRDFPVFLHPTTREEYALARTERKSAPGYYGFVCDFSPHVRLEEDLARRDLTVNAMAMSGDGELIDPYHGQADLAAKVLRHVSPAFVEDPVRVLRVARFAARFYSFGFKVADETRVLMYHMVKRGELASLVPERVWQEWQRSLLTEHPDAFINTLRSCGALRVILPELDALFGVPGSPRYHPEVDTGVHSVMALKAAVALSDDPVVRFAALIHDLGKACTKAAQWPSHPGHGDAGLPVIEALCQRLRIPADYGQLALMASRFHTAIHQVYALDAEAIVSTLEHADAFRRPEGFEKLLLVCEADASGIGRRVDYQQAHFWRHLLVECTQVNAKMCIEEGYQGAAIKAALHERRVRRVYDLLLEK